MQWVFRHPVHLRYHAETPTDSFRLDDVEGEARQKVEEIARKLQWGYTVSKGGFYLFFLFFVLGLVFYENRKEKGRNGEDNKDNKMNRKWKRKKEMEK